MNSIMASILRHALTILGSWLVTKGYMDDAAAQSAIGALVTLISVVWGALQQKKAKTMVTAVHKELANTKDELEVTRDLLKKRAEYPTQPRNR